MVHSVKVIKTLNAIVVTLLWFHAFDTSKTVAISNIC